MRRKFYSYNILLNLLNKTEGQKIDRSPKAWLIVTLVFEFLNHSFKIYYHF